MIEKDTIVAQATPYGHSSVAIIRTSGPNSLRVVNTITHSDKPLLNRRAVLLPIYIDGFKKIDEAVFTYFANPKSYTGEDVVEISCHGNPVIVELVVEAICENGARIAEPGEFTKRAFFNNKIDLSQAEAVGSLISAQSKEAVEHQVKNLSGVVSAEVKKIKTSLINILSSLEFQFDISEFEGDLNENVNKFYKELKNNTLSVLKILKSYDMGVAYTSGFRVVICGLANAGKSTMMNSMVKSNRSITSSISGTTRDVITSSMIIGGVPITLVDTAGLEKTSNEIEKEGVERAKKEIDKADLILSVSSPDTKKIDLGLRENILDVYNKIDSLKKLNKKKGVIYISALKKTGVDNLLKEIKNRLFLRLESPGSTINTIRQKESLDSCFLSTQTAMGILKTNPGGLELVAYEVREAINSLDSFLGKTTTDEILDSVFSGFCVGK